MEKHILRQSDQTFHQLLEREYTKKLRILEGIVNVVKPTQIPNVVKFKNFLNTQNCVLSVTKAHTLMMSKNTLFIFQRRLGRNYTESTISLANKSRF